MTIFDPFYSSLYALGFRDPIHPPLTHITIGVVAAALVFGLLAWVWRQPFLARAARYCLVMAWVSLFPTVLLGLMDWQHWYQGGWPQPIFIKICLAACLFLVLSLGMILVVTGRVESRALPAIYLVAFFTVMGLGYFGGRLVFGGRAPAVPPKLEAGRRLFQNHCMACHPNLGNAILPDMTIIGSDNLTDLPGFLAFIRAPRLDNGQKGPMPDFPARKISDDQARELYAYLTGVLKGASHQDP
jgi:uncharacterized membrane protein